MRNSLKISGFRVGISDFIAESYEIKQIPPKYQVVKFHCDSQYVTGKLFLLKIFKKQGSGLGTQVL